MNALQLVPAATFDAELLIKKSARCAKVKAGVLPSPITVFRKAAWLRTEVDSIKVAMASGADDDALKVLAQKLVAKRAELAPVQ